MLYAFSTLDKYNRPVTAVCAADTREEYSQWVSTMSLISDIKHVAEYKRPTLFELLRNAEYNDFDDVRLFTHIDEQHQTKFCVMNNITIMPKSHVLERISVMKPEDAFEKLGADSIPDEDGRVTIGNILGIENKSSPVHDERNDSRNPILSCDAVQALRSKDVVASRTNRTLLSVLTRSYERLSAIRRNTSGEFYSLETCDGWFLYAVESTHKETLISLFPDDEIKMIYHRDFTWGYDFRVNNKNRNDVIDEISTRMRKSLRDRNISAPDDLIAECVEVPGSIEDKINVLCRKLNMKLYGLPYDPNQASDHTVREPVVSKQALPTTIQTFMEMRACTDYTYMVVTGCIYDHYFTLPFQSDCVFPVEINVIVCGRVLMGNTMSCLYRVKDPSKETYVVAHTLDDQYIVYKVME